MGEMNDRGKSIAGVGNEHTSFAHGSISHSNTLYKPRRAHFSPFRTTDFLLLSEFRTTDRISSSSSSSEI